MKSSADTNESRPSLAQQIVSIIQGKMTVYDVVAHCLENIKKHNDGYRAYITVFEQDALDQAEKLDSTFAKTPPKESSLCGAPLGIKDNINVPAYPTTCAVELFRNFIPSTDAQVIKDLKNSDAIILGKNNMHALALGATSTSSIFGPVVNPFDKTRIAGGSSGGTAVAVATGMASAGVGTDTGGSVRIPATFCGIVGFKPTYGLLSIEGVIPLSYTLDHVGILANNAEDCKMILQSILQWKKSSPPKEKIILGISKPFCTNLEPAVEKDFEDALDKIGGHEFELKEIEFCDPAQVHEDRVKIMLKEAATIYSKPLHENSQLFPQDVRSLLTTGENTEMEAYVNSLKTRSSVVNRCLSAFREVDYFVMPTIPILAPKVDEVLGKESSDIRKGLLRNTSFGNLTGLPTITIPLRGGNNFCTGFQVTANYGRDLELLDFASFLEGIFE